SRSTSRSSSGGSASCRARSRSCEPRSPAVSRHRSGYAGFSMEPKPLRSAGSPRGIPRYSFFQGPLRRGLPRLRWLDLRYVAGWITARLISTPLPPSMGVRTLPSCLSRLWRHSVLLEALGKILLYRIGEIFLFGLNWALTSTGKLVSRQRSLGMFLLNGVEVVIGFAVIFSTFGCIPVAGPARTTALYNSFRAAVTIGPSDVLAN